MITVSGTPSGTLITVNSWALYQYGGTASGTQTSQQTSQQTSPQTSHEQELDEELNNKNERRKEPPVPEDRGYQT